jgi:hypothetical protein
VTAAYRGAIVTCQQTDRNAEEDFMKMPLCIAMVLVLSAAVVLADQEAANVPVVRSSTYGRVYARSVPAGWYGQEGVTCVYSVGEEEDTLISEYPWYANEIYIGGSGDATVVRFGPWHGGSEPGENDLALGIYRDGQVIREYSTLELYELGSGVQPSVSHYRILQRRLGFSWLEGDRYVFQVEGISGILFTFDLDSGELLEP